jgi:hypothetical protein
VPVAGKIICCVSGVCAVDLSPGTLSSLTDSEAVGSGDSGRLAHLPKMPNTVVPNTWRNPALSLQSFIPASRANSIKVGGLLSRETRISLA